MLNSHSRVAIAQIVLYVPVAPLAVFVLHRNKSKRPRMAWIPLLPFSLIRLVGGIITILLNNNSGSVGLIIATLILLGIGLIPLIISVLGFIRIVLTSSLPPQHQAHRAIVGIRILFSIAAGLLISGGSLDGSYKNSNLVSIGQKLVKAGYFVFAGIVAMEIVFHIYLWRVKAKLSETSMVILKATSLALPFLVIRTVYALLSAFATSLNSKWNTIYGSAVAFALMALLMEYVAVCIFLYIGLTIPSSRHPREGQEGSADWGENQEFSAVVLDNSQAKQSDGILAC